MSGGSPLRSSGVVEFDDYGNEMFDFPAEGDEEDEDDEHIIVTMLRSMNSKKLETR